MEKSITLRRTCFLRFCVFQGFGKRTGSAAQPRNTGAFTLLFGYCSAAAVLGKRARLGDLKMDRINCRKHNGAIVMINERASGMLLRSAMPRRDRSY